jgi:regulator of cell morphogenesis and NO signaling
MILTTHKTVRELAVQIPGATRVFEEIGIDYCCGGNRSLDDACTSVGMTLDHVMNLLETATNAQTKCATPDFRQTTLADLIGHIVRQHHAFTKTEIARLRTLIVKVETAHGQNHPELTKLSSLFRILSDGLGPHMNKEERVLFPFIIGMEDGTQNNNPRNLPPFGTVANPIKMMMFEHDSAGYLLKQMREVSAGYTIPPDACMSFRTLYQALDAFEKDLHQHIHLENNILFPRALDMESFNTTSQMQHESCSS